MVSRIHPMRDPQVPQGAQQRRDPGQPKHVALRGDGLLAVSPKMARAEIADDKRFWAPAHRPHSPISFVFFQPAFGDMT